MCVIVPFARSSFACSWIVVFYGVAGPSCVCDGRNNDDEANDLERAFHNGNLKGEFSIIIDAVPAEPTEGTIDTLDEFAIFLALRVLDSRRRGEAPV